jgi:ACS family hexuronate transporter-like MFS transporter
MRLSIDPIATGGPLPPVWRQVRWRILLLLLAITIVNFVDRQSLSIVAPVLRERLSLSNTGYGIIVSCFMLGMMIGEFPMGWLMDRRGVRFGLPFAVAWWSLANGLHAFGRSMLHFSVLRFWLGTGECGNYSGGMKTVAQWFPVRERAFAVGVFNAGSMIGAVIAPPLIVWIMLQFGWHAAFLIPSSLGFLWVWCWLTAFRAPAEHPRLSEAERQYISEGSGEEGAPPPNAQLLRVPQTWAVMLCRALVGPVVQFYWFWMPEYFYRARGFSLKSIGMFTWAPYLVGDFGSIGGGLAAGYLLHRGMSVDSTRRATMLLGGALCLSSLAVALTPSAGLAIGLISCVMFGHTFLSANMFAVISDFFPKNAVGRVTALTGISGGMSGMLFPLLSGYLVDRVSYLPVFAMAAFLPLAGALALFLVGGRVRPVNLQEG